jgi:hypothetical protein
MSTILWQDITNGALDRCQLGATPSGLRLAGTVLTAAHGDPLEVRYLVTTDEIGLTRRVELDLDNGSTRRVLLADGAGHWNWDGDPELTDVAGSLDVDLTVTPATNTLPIRRLGLEVGQAADLRMAWVQFPGLGDPFRATLRALGRGSLEVFDRRLSGGASRRPRRLGA